MADVRAEIEVEGVVYEATVSINTAYTQTVSFEFVAASETDGPIMRPAKAPTK